ncbi:hypothetical protein DJ92_5821 (plasmid) [Bacillus pseudomycoides]|nr:hypothetical protein DJ92_5821 [Bacillus pseudomycoides]
MASVNGKRTGGSIKELTYLLHPDPLVVVKRYPFDPAYRRGSSLKNEGGGGVFLWGLGKISPVGLGKAQGLFLPCYAWLGKAGKRRRPLSILMR